MNQLFKSDASAEGTGFGASSIEREQLAISSHRGLTRELPKHRRFAGPLLVVLGIVLLQAILYGPSLTGRKILLPLDILAQPDVYLPRISGVTNIPPRNPSVSDLVYGIEPQRVFAVSELRSGRLPMWAPYEFGGVPFIFPKFSPFLLLECCTASPVVLAWSRVCQALVAGLGAYFFILRALQLRFGPAAICGICYPLTAYFILWQGFPTNMTVCWLPWVMLAVDRTLRGAGLLAPIGLGLSTGLALVSGAIDAAGQVLLGSGLYALWCLGQYIGSSERPLTPALSPSEGERGNDLQSRCERRVVGRKAMTIQVARSVLFLALGWALGFALAAPYLLPVVEYARTGTRAERRAAGTEARPPIGLSALPQIVMPDMYGTNENGSLRYASDGQTESSAAGYVGLVATLLVAPLAFCNRRHRRRNLFWALLLLFSLSWCLDIAGFTQILRLPGLKMLSHNRMVFLGAFALLMLAAEGLEVLASELAVWRRWMWWPAGLLAVLGLWCCFRAFSLPAPVQATLAPVVVRGKVVPDRNPGRTKRIRLSYVRYYAAAGAWCGLGFLGWIALRARPRFQTTLLPILGTVCVAELLYFSYGRNDQCDPSLYYPEIPVLKQVAAASPDRIMGYGCLPPLLSAVRGLQDIRGYDAVDPARMVQLLLKAADPKSQPMEYAATQLMKPVATITSQGTVQLMPLLNMLSVRYVIFRGPILPKAQPKFQGPDYWVLENPAALPRIFVPHRAEVVTNDVARLEKLASAQFDPHDVVYLETPGVQALPEECKGTAEIIDEIPTRVRVSVQMETAGVVVLSDRWDKGWHAYLNEKEVPILRVNHAIRGVVVPPGKGQLEFRYNPMSFTLGVGLAALSSLVMLAWFGFEIGRRWNERAGVKVGLAEVARVLSLSNPAPGQREAEVP